MLGILQQADGSLAFRPHPGSAGVRFSRREGGGDHYNRGYWQIRFAHYDSMVAQVIVHAKTRNAAADKLIAYLDKVAISGICTNIPLLKLVLADDVFRKEKYDTDYLPQLLKRTDIEKLIAEIDASSGSAGSGIDRDSVLIDGTDEMKVLAPATAIFYNTPSLRSQNTSA